MAERPNISWAGDTAWKDYILECRIKLETSPGMGRGVIFRARNSENYYIFNFSATGAALDYIRGETPTALTPLQKDTFALDQWHQVRIAVVGDSIRCYVNGLLYVDVSHAALPQGRIGIYSGPAKTWFDDVKVTEVKPE
jgi:hypothetical protein